MNIPHINNVLNFRLLGFATGNYFCTCANCQCSFQGDKRSCQCLDCAIKVTESIFDEYNNMQKEIENIVDEVDNWNNIGISIFRSFTP